MLLRIALFLVPDLVILWVGILLPSMNFVTLDWIAEGYNVITISGLLGTTIWLATIRRRIVYKEVNESRQLLWGSSFALIHFLLDLAWWYLVMASDPSRPAYLIVHHCITLIPCDAVFSCTVGWCLWNVIKSRAGANSAINPDAVGDSVAVAAAASCAAQRTAELKQQGQGAGGKGSSAGDAGAHGAGRGGLATGRGWVAGRDRARKSTEVIDHATEDAEDASGGSSDDDRGRDRESEYRSGGDVVGPNGVEMHPVVGGGGAEGDRAWHANPMRSAGRDGSGAGMNVV